MPNLPTIALVGAGTHGQGAVLPALQSLQSQLSICGIVEPAPPLKEKLALAIPGVPVYDSIEELLQHHTPTIVYVATLPHLHEPMTIRALEAGCHVVCEKPLAPSIEACERMVESAERLGRVLVTMFENRYKKHSMQMREWIQTGRIGRVEAIHYQKLGSHPIAEPRRTNLVNASGSLDCGIHSLDLSRYLVNGGDWETVHALGQWFEEQHLENPPHTAILARLDNGTLVTMNDSLSYRIASAKRLGAWPDYGTLHIVGTRGVIEAVSGGYRMLPEEGEEEFVAFDAASHAEEIPHVILDMLAVIEGRDSPTGFLPTGRDGLIAQHIVAEANRHARETRKMVDERPLAKPGISQRH